MKNRFDLQDNILDAGCGNGRNMHWFLRNDYKIYGIDSDNESIATLKKKYPLLAADRFRVCAVEKTSFQSTHFDHIICSAVLHFANNTSHFSKMLEEMVRILKPGGSLFIRMTSDIGIEDKVELIGDGVFRIPDGSIRFLLNRQLLKDCLKEFNMSFLEPLKTVNVDDIRCMSTLVLQKN
jgi:ubiquinone/menaquinone biosynthesis C-methylase UbiE